MNKRQAEKAWLFFQALFLVHFTPTVLRVFLRIPRLEIPYLNSLSLIGVYAMSLYGLPLSDLYNKIEFACVLLFLSQPPKILLFPFYINSVVNLAVFVASHPRRNRRGLLCRTAQFVIARQAAIIDTKILIEILNLPLCIFLIILGYSNMITLLIYGYLLRTQFENDQVVRNVFLKLRVALDKYSLLAPPGIRDIYVKGRDYLILATFDRKNK